MDLQTKTEVLKNHHHDDTLNPMTIKLPHCQCNRCKHIWVPRTDKRPKFCPICHSPYWDKERIRK